MDTPEGRGTVVEVDLLRSRVKVRMEDSPETISVFANADIAILRSGKAKKNDPPIPADLAPISGAGKRVRRELKTDEPVLLEPIRFRYSTEKIVEEPEAVEPEAEVAEEAAAEAGDSKSSRSRRRRRNRGKGENKEAAPAAEAPKAESPKAEPFKEQPKAEPAQTEAAEAPGEEGAAKKSSRRRNHYRRRKPNQTAEG